MESVKALLESKKIVISLQYYGIQDLGASWEVKSIVDNQDIFADLYSHFPLTAIDCLDDYFLYLLSLKYNGPRELDHGIEKKREHGIMRLTKGRSANHVIQNVHVGIQGKGSHRGSPGGEGPQRDCRPVQPQPQYGPELEVGVS